MEGEREATDEESTTVLDSLWLLCMELEAGDLPSTRWCHMNQKTQLSLGICRQRKVGIDMLAEEKPD